MVLLKLLQRLSLGAAAKTSPKYRMTTTRTVDVHSDEDFGDDATLVMELVLWHQISIISAHELVHLGNNSKTVSAWISDNIRPLSAARRKDDTADWYFPLHFRESVDNRCSSWSWSGIHHSSGEIHQLFALDHLPSVWIRNLGYYPCDYGIIAGSGGLLLITYPRTGFLINYPATTGFRDLREVLQTTNFRRYGPLPAAATSQNWKPLVVSNPLTREWKVLQAPDCRDVGVTSWDYIYSSLRIHMLVDDEANSYKLVFVSRNYVWGSFVLVYKSSCNSWACRAFPDQPDPWGDFASCVGASVCVGGRLYFADMKVRASTLPVYVDDADFRGHGCLRVFELEEESGTWKPPILYALRDFFLQNPDRDQGFGRSSYAFEIVECMGSMYAVIPARLNMLATIEEIGRTYDGDDDALRKFCNGFMPLQFHIIRLQGEAGLAQGILRIHIPDDVLILSVQLRMGSLKEKLIRNHLRMLRRRAMRALNENPHLSMFYNTSWFRCTARGSVIWVTWDDYLLQYDVVSGQSKTQILPDTLFADAPDFSYRPSFHMKP